MDRQPGAAHLDRFLVQPGAAVLFAELRKSNRRRILLDAAPKVFDSRMLSHGIEPTRLETGIRG